MQHLMLGSYSTHKQTQIGTGTTSKSGTQQHIMWLAAQLPSAKICVQPLDPDNIPTGIVNTVDSADFFQHYVPEAACYNRHIRPGVQKLSAWIGAEGTPLPPGEPDREIKLFLRAFLAVLHEEAGIALREGELDDLRLLVRQALGMRVLDHLQISLSLAAIRLRKERNYKLAVDYYARALQIREDDHILFNMARTYYEMKEIASAKKCLLKALAINPKLAVAQQFLDFINTPAAH